MAQLVSWNLQLPNLEPSVILAVIRGAQSFRVLAMLQSASGLYVMEGPLHPEKSCLWKDSNDDRVSVDLLRFNLFELQVVGSVLFSTARPTSGSRPPSRVRIHPCFFSGGVGGFSECSKDAAICTCRMLSPVLRRSFPCAQLEL